MNLRGRPLRTSRVAIGAIAALVVSLIATGATDRQQQFSADPPLATRQTLEESDRSRLESEQSPDKKYWKHTFGPTAAARAAAGAGLTQASNTPSEWHQGMEGFGKRFASSFAKHIVKKGIQYPVSKLFHEELTYRPSGLTGFGPRLKYALLGVVMTHKTTNGQRTVAKGEFTGAIGSGFISRLWQPASVHTAAAGVSSAGLTLGADAAGNVLREFWPEIRHPRSRHKESHNSSAALGKKAPQSVDSRGRNP